MLTGQEASEGVMFLGSPSPGYLGTMCYTYKACGEEKEKLVKIHQLFTI